MSLSKKGFLFSFWVIWLLLLLFMLLLFILEEYILFETGSISEFDYYTGIIFAGYTYGNGEPIVTGGRYNNLLANFGKDRPAIGFGIFIDQLQMALNKQNILVTSKKNKIISNSIWWIWCNALFWWSTRGRSN